MLPVVPVTDLVVHDNDLAVSTQGRGFWILDDLAPLREIAGAMAGEATHLFTPSTAYLFGGPGGGFGGGGVGANPPRGALIYYTLAREATAKEAVTLEFLDEAGKLIRKISSKADEVGGAQGAAAGVGDAADRANGPPAPRIPAKAGLNRFAWNFRYPDASRFKGMILWDGDVHGPEVTPGRYQVRMTAYGVTQTRDIEIQKDPRLTATPADYRARCDFLLEVRDKLTEAHDGINRIRDVRDQLKAVTDRAATMDKDSSIAVAAKKLTTQLTAVEEALYQTKNKSGQDPLNYPIRLNNKLASLANSVESADAPPTDQALAVLHELGAKVATELAKLKELMGSDLPAFNRLVSDKAIPAVVVKEPKKAE